MKYQCIFVMLLVTYAQNCGSVSQGGAISQKNSRYYVTPQISLDWMYRFFIIWVHMIALNLLFHCGYDSYLCSGK